MLHVLKCRLPYCWQNTCIQLLLGSRKFIFITGEERRRMRSEYISLQKEDLSDMSLTQVYYLQGKQNASCYTSSELLAMLEGPDLYETYEAIGAISQLKLKEALDRLKQKALFDDDQGIQEEAVRTIRRIGGRKALHILRFLKVTEHRNLVEGILKYGADYTVSPYLYQEYQ
jgi:hypothetical protein